MALVSKRVKRGSTKLAQNLTCEKRKKHHNNDIVTYIIHN